MPGGSPGRSFHLLRDRPHPIPSFSGGTGGRGKSLSSQRDRTQVIVRLDGGGEPETWRHRFGAHLPRNFFLALPDTSSPDGMSSSGKGAEMTRPTKSTTRGLEQMCFALAATACMVFAHPDHITSIVAPPARIGGRPAAMGDMPSMGGTLREWCPTLILDPSGWRLGRDEWSMPLSRSRPSIGQGTRLRSSQRRAERGHRSRVVDKDHL